MDRNGIPQPPALLPAEAVVHPHVADQTVANQDGSHPS